MKKYGITRFHFVELQQLQYVWNTPIPTQFNSYRHFYWYLLHKHEVNAVEHNSSCSYLKCCIYLHTIKKQNTRKKTPKAPNKTSDLVPCVQIQAEIFQCMKDTVRPWQAAVYCIVWFLPPSLPQYWSSLNRLKCYRGSHHKIQPACSMNIISTNVRNQEAQET